MGPNSISILQMRKHSQRHQVTYWRSHPQQMTDLSARCPHLRPWHLPRRPSVWLCIGVPFPLSQRQEFSLRNVSVEGIMCRLQHFSPEKGTLKSSLSYLTIKLLGAHSAKGSNFSSLEDLGRKKLFWCCYCFDSLMWLQQEQSFPKGRFRLGVMGRICSCVASAVTQGPGAWPNALLAAILNLSNFTLWTRKAWRAVERALAIREHRRAGAVCAVFVDTIGPCRPIALAMPQGHRILVDPLRMKNSAGPKANAKGTQHTHEACFSRCLPVGSFCNMLALHWLCLSLAQFLDRGSQNSVLVFHISTSRTEHREGWQPWEAVFSIWTRPRHMQTEGGDVLRKRNHLELHQVCPPSCCPLH